ncbi:hypothetical protein Hypma_005162 [Hypsizygus marmoreus]|uniref:HNH nuclease domain-containing protein n=1 Tax=Hypsizygus marmoreus TaxID=39966 RepID=A0A369K0E9_HYPMA|nr:hypothetical protein Hypma_005162 [Hypsizygus marmoreus]
MFEPQPLPSIPSNYAPATSLHDAYTRCLDYELAATNFPDNAFEITHLHAARLLGYLVLHAPTDNGRSNLCSEIIYCFDHAALFELGMQYNNRLIRVFQRISDPTPPPSPSPSRPFYVHAEVLPQLLTDPPSYTRSRKLTLIRDGYRSQVTGTYEAGAQEYGAIPVIPWAGLTMTEACHIIPEFKSTFEIAGGGLVQPESKAGVIEHYGDVSITQELLGQAAHRLENILTLDANLHASFTGLSVWFELTSVPNQYRVEAAHPGFLLGIDRLVTFTSADTRLPLPSPRYLALHAACAKAAHLSGVRVVNYKISSNIHSSRTMANGGESAELLAAALSRVVF